MTHDKQVLAIAFACGWSVSDRGWWSHPTLPDNGGAEPEPPDYLNDLNACHEMEKVLTEPQHGDFIAHLAIITGWVEEVEGCDDDGTPSKEMVDWIWDSAHATAAQRAESFLKTLGKWEESL